MSANDITYGVVSREELLSQDGLTLLSRMAKGDLPAPPIAELMGIRIT
ncbi:MAG: PaaI family thioesterase, partial [Rhodobiaceae bacterium]|nr:PaaI family thioesterase [Rhodobiaceae bacterium]